MRKPKAVGIIGNTMERKHSIRTSASSSFEELTIRARSPWHRDQYNREFESACARGLSPEDARNYAIERMSTHMQESRIRRAAPADPVER